MVIELNYDELVFLELALNDAMDNTDNKARYKVYNKLLTKLNDKRSEYEEQR